jgi:ParB family chromosome partitioning protein
MNTTDLPRIPLSPLHLSPLNARKVRPKDIDGLAASIAAHGLLQNLTVTVNDKPGQYEVVAGGRRLAAMQQLAQEGRLPGALARDGVPCLVIDDNDVAHEASTAENTLREAMHTGGKPTLDHKA